MQTINKQNAIFEVQDQYSSVVHPIGIKFLDKKYSMTYFLNNLKCYSNQLTVLE